MPFWINLIVALAAFGVSAVTGKFLIPLLKKLHFGQTIYEKGPAWHKSKQGTPMMGGFMFIIGTTVAVALGYALYRFKSADPTVIPDNTGLYRLLAGFAYALLNAGIGFIDDYTKVVRKNNDGLTAIQKIILQTIFSVGFLFALHVFGGGRTSINLGFWETPNLGIFYYILMFAVIIYLTNAVNLTDGVDGLCGSVTFTAMLIYRLQVAPWV